MKKLQLAKWLLVGAISAVSFACQTKNSAPSKNPTPCMEDKCPAPPEAPYQDKVPCREGECDETEASQEAMLHVIEIPDATEEKSAAAEPAPTEEKSVAKEEEPSNSVSLQSPEAPAEETSKSPEIKFEEPTTHIFEDLPHNPVSENTVVLSLKE